MDDSCLKEKHLYKIHFPVHLHRYCDAFVIIIMCIHIVMA